MYRQSPDREQDSGWRVFAGDEPQEYLDETANCVLVPLRELLEKQPALEELFRTPAPVAYEQGEDGGFVAVDYTPESD